MRMGALGRRGHGGHKNKASRGNLGSHRPGFGCYGRGNFPGHDVLDGCAKNGANGCRWVQVDADGGDRGNGHGQEQKQGKKSRNWMRRACFPMHVHRDKNENVCRDDHGGQRGRLGGMVGAKKRCAVRYGYL